MEETTVQLMHIVNELGNKVIPRHVVIGYNLQKLQRKNITDFAKTVLD